VEKRHLEVAGRYAFVGRPTPTRILSDLDDAARLVLKEYAIEVPSIKKLIQSTPGRADGLFAGGSVSHRKAASL
jgi:hypothetical protein